MPISFSILQKSDTEKPPRPDHLKLITTLLNDRPVKNIDAVTMDGVTSVWIAASAGDADAIHLLAEQKADLDKPDNSREKRTPAMIAAYYGHAAVINALKQRGANIDKAMEDGTTAAIVAARYGHASVIAELAKGGANLTKADNNGNTPALFAAANGHAAVITELGKAGVDLSKPTEKGNTPLHCAIINGSFPSIKVLLDYGVRFNIQDKKGKFPLDYATDEVKAFIALQQLKKYIEAHQWGNSCPLIVSKHLKLIKEADANGNWSMALKNVMTSIPTSIHPSTLFATQDAIVQNYLRLLSSPESLKEVKKPSEEKNSIALERKKPDIF